jgi:hypothetical protein
MAFPKMSPTDVDKLNEKFHRAKLSKSLKNELNNMDRVKYNMWQVALAERELKEAKQDLKEALENQN